MSQVVRVAVTGAAGQVAYAMLGRLASGEIFGPNTQVILQLLEITPAMQALEGVAMELEDCSFPTLKEIIPTDDPARAFKDCNFALLVGSFPRKQGIERKDLLGINGKIFVGQGKALAENAAKDVAHPGRRQSVQHQLPGRLPQWPGHSRRALDGHDPARPQPGPQRSAKKAGVANAEVTQVTIWGNHSNNQYPDFTNARIKGKPATEVIPDRGWLENTFVPQCQNRGTAVIRPAGSARPCPPPTGPWIMSGIGCKPPLRRLGQCRHGFQGGIWRAGRLGI